MPVLTDSVKKAWEDRQGPVVFTTVGKDGNQNNIYSTDASMYGEDRFVVANQFIDKSMKERLPDSTGSLVFVTSDHKLFLVKGHIHYEYKGKNYEFMKSWSDDRHPGHGAAVIDVSEIYENGERVV